MKTGSSDFFDRLVADRARGALYILGCWLAGAAVQALVLIVFRGRPGVREVAVVLAMVVPFLLMYPLIRRYAGSGWEPRSAAGRRFRAWLAHLVPPESLPRVLVAAALLAIAALLLQAILARAF